MTEARSVRRDWIALAVCCAVYLVAFGVFYPRTHAIEDEVGFLNQALVWSQGAVSAEGAGFASLPDFVEIGGRHVAWRNPGRSLLALPFLLLGGYAATFASGALIHLLTVLACACSLRRMERSPLWALLVLAHPTLALYSRTIMADGLGGLGLALAFLAVVGLRRPGLWAGLAVGLAASARYQTGLVLPFLVLALWRAGWIESRRREALLCLAAGGAVGLLLVAYNLWLLGHPLGQVNQGHFSLAYLGRNSLHYALCLSLLWPGLLFVAPLWRGRERAALAALALPLLLLLLVYYFFDQRPRWYETVVVGQRLLQPILPLLVLAYACALATRVAPWLSGLVGPRALRVAAYAACAALLAAMSLLMGRHHQYLEGLMRTRAAFERSVPAGSLVLANRGLSKLYEVPYEGLPSYRWRYYEHQGLLLAHYDEVEAEAALRPWFLADLRRDGGPPPQPWRDYSARYRCDDLRAAEPRLLIYRCGARAGDGN